MPELLFLGQLMPVNSNFKFTPTLAAVKQLSFHHNQTQFLFFGVRDLDGSSERKFTLLYKLADRKLIVCGHK